MDPRICEDDRAWARGRGGYVAATHSAAYGRPPPSFPRRRESKLHATPGFSAGSVEAEFQAGQNGSPPLLEIEGPGSLINDRSCGGYQELAGLPLRRQ